MASVDQPAAIVSPVYVEVRSRQLPPVGFTEAEYEALRAFARADGLSLADLVREALKAFTGVECGRRPERASARSIRRVHRPRS